MSIDIFIPYPELSDLASAQFLIPVFVLLAVIVLSLAEKNGRYLNKTSAIFASILYLMLLAGSLVLPAGLNTGIIVIAIALYVLYCMKKDIKHISQ